MQRLNILPSVAAILYLLSLSLSDAQDSGDHRFVTELNDGLIAYVNQEYLVALPFLEPLSEKNEPLAQLFVGRVFANGYGTPQNCERGVTWLARAAQGGNAEAAFDLASFSEQGHCMPHSIIQALAWHEIAAANGDIRPPNAIGEIYLGREGTEPDPQKMIFWFERSVMLFDPVAYYHLGEMYAIGEGVPKDYIEAYKWFDLSVGLEIPPDHIFGVTNAAVARDKIREKLTPAQVADGQRRVSEFTNKYFRTNHSPNALIVSAANCPPLILFATADRTEQCPLLAQSRHYDRADKRPFLGVKRTSMLKAFTSAFDPKRTFDHIIGRRTELRFAGIYAAAATATRLDSPHL